MMRRPFRTVEETPGVVVRCSALTLGVSDPKGVLTVTRRAVHRPPRSGSLDRKV